MAVVRIVTDIEVSREVSRGDLTKVAKAAQEHADGVLAEMYFARKDRAPRSKAHVHASTDDHSCRACIRHAQDEVQ